jgi:hypothetical protein
VSSGRGGSSGAQQGMTEATWLAQIEGLVAARGRATSSSNGWGGARPHHCSLYEPDTTSGPSDLKQAQPGRFLSCNASEGKPVKRCCLAETAERVNIDVLRKGNCVITPPGPSEDRHTCGLAGSALFGQVGLNAACKRRSHLICQSPSCAPLLEGWVDSRERK